MASAGSSDDDARFEFKMKQRLHALQTNPAVNLPRGNIPNTPLASATIAFILGGVFVFGLYTAAIDLSATASLLTYRLGLFIASWSFFHWAEFAVTAGWNLEKCSIDSYLLDNGAMYHIANGTAVFEYLVGCYFFPSYKSFAYISQLGILFVVCGQTLRSIAMVHASTNFSHTVAFRKRDTHRLVTDGVYGWFRHPSYAGFYYWALGTQLLLQNPITFLLFAGLLWSFFYKRTRAEENALIQFFGDDYRYYRRRVGTKIPFVP